MASPFFVRFDFHECYIQISRLEISAKDVASLKMKVENTQLGNFLTNLPTWPWPMKLNINLIGGLSGHVGKHDLFKCV